MHLLFLPCFGAVFKVEIAPGQRRQNRMYFDEDLVVGVYCAILLRGRSQRMSLLQHVISLILYCGHASKQVCYNNVATIIDLQVYTRLQKLCLSLSHKAMSRCVEKLGRDFNAPIVKWCDDIMRKMSEVY